LDSIQTVFQNSVNNLHQVGFQESQDRLRLRVTKTGVELQNPGTLAGDHQSRVEYTAIEPAFFAQGADHGNQNLFHRLPVDFRGVDRRRGISSHTSGIGALIPIISPLVVLGRNHGNYVDPVGKSQDADLFTYETLLHHKAVSRITIGPVFHDPTHPIQGRLLIHGNNYTLARSQTVRLDHTGGADFLDISRRLPGISKDSVSSRGNAVLGHDLLGYYLASFNLSRSPGGSKNLQPRCLKLVDNTRSQRRFGTDDGQIYLLFQGKS
jgi:hypothetical protein